MELFNPPLDCCSRVPLFRESCLLHTNSASPSLGSGGLHEKQGAPNERAHCREAAQRRSGICVIWANPGTCPVAGGASSFGNSLLTVRLTLAHNSEKKRSLVFIYCCCIACSDEKSIFLIMQKCEHCYTWEKDDFMGTLKKAKQIR